MHSSRSASDRYHPWAAAVAIGCALLLAACGSTGPSSAQTSTNATNAALLVKYAGCMRAHGVPGFPDPSTSQDGDNSFGVDGYNFNLPANLNTQSPAYESADKACDRLIGLGGSGPARNPALVAKAREAALAHAQCMRQHGVPNFPDPTVSGGGGGITVSSGGPGIDPQSPAFQQAQKTCQPNAPR
ncbi:MAG TPA: hypothetical protein VMA77_15495 [Solirubrobacteraceae bacterium]|nr:hypothetical protein [Solirubrobacteraceae bacterium]